MLWLSFKAVNEQILEYLSNWRTQCVAW